ncbi:hypothetical protein ACFC0K_37795 [Streptomyces hydrogenans]|uniref:hypothetical protein n=1 Tax=Streptomyces hydrogenans TaxID=1873719 RepID=UPI0035DC7275
MRRTATRREAREAGARSSALAADHRIVQLQALARIALAKMKLLCLAGDVSLVAVAATAAAILTR